MNPIPKTGVINPKAEYIITVSWADNNPDDIDTYVQNPTGGLVWFRSKESEFVHLDRDDRGIFADKMNVNGAAISNPINQEIVTVRKLQPGEYVVNLLHYKANYPEPLEVDVLSLIHI